jgi:hypothetical protein
MLILVEKTPGSRITTRNRYYTLTQSGDLAGGHAAEGSGSRGRESHWQSGLPHEWYFTWGVAGIFFVERTHLELHRETLTGVAKTALAHFTVFGQGITREHVVS